MASTISTMMNAWKVRIGKAEPIRTKVPIPQPGPGEVLVRLLAMGCCHSDCTILGLKSAAPDWNWEQEFILGHEGAGEIVKLGNDNNNKNDLAVGDKVAIHIVPGCDEKDVCPSCAQDLHRACRRPGSGNYGIGHNGVFAEYISVSARACVKVPKEVSIEQAAISMDAINTAYGAVKNAANVQPGQTLLIFGLGGLGLNGLQIAQHMMQGKGRILVADRKKEAVEMAVKFGVPEEDAFCLAEGAPTAHEIVAERGILVDTVLDFTGHEASIMSAQLALRDAGLIVMVGLLSDTVSLMPILMVSKMITIKGSYNASVQDMRDCLDLVAQGIVTPHITTGSIEDLPETLKALDEGKITGRRVLLPTWRDE